MIGNFTRTLIRTLHISLHPSLYLCIPLFFLDNNPFTNTFLLERNIQGTRKARTFARICGIRYPDSWYGNREANVAPVPDLGLDQYRRNLVVVITNDPFTIHLKPKYICVAQGVRCDISVGIHSPIKTDRIGGGISCGRGVVPSEVVIV